MLDNLLFAGYTLEFHYFGSGGKNANLFNELHSQRCDVCVECPETSCFPFHVFKARIINLSEPSPNHNKLKWEDKRRFSVYFMLTLDIVRLSHIFVLFSMHQSRQLIVWCAIKISLKWERASGFKIIIIIIVTYIEKYIKKMRFRFNRVRFLPLVWWISEVSVWKMRRFQRNLFCSRFTRLFASLIVITIFQHRLDEIAFVSASCGDAQNIRNCKPFLIQAKTDDELINQFESQQKSDETFFSDDRFIFTTMRC